MVSRYTTGNATPAKRFWSTFIAQVTGSVDFVTILTPVEIIARPSNIAAEIVKARMTAKMLAFNFAWKT